MVNRYREEFSPSLVVTESMSISTTALMHPESMLRHWKYGSIIPTPHRDELDYYLRAALEPEDVYPIDYWKANKLKYPILASMAWDILSIPAMTSEVERVFSGAKLMITDTRNRLKPDIIEACECYHAWMKAGLVEST